MEMDLSNLEDVIKQVIKKEKEDRLAMDLPFYAAIFLIFVCVLVCLWMWR